MRLSWPEIRANAARFAEEWKDARYERGETQSFYNDFFEVFGANRRRVATYEEPVKRLGNKRGFIDLFWKGKLLVEQKSAGRDLKRAKEQALDYFPELKDYELPVIFSSATFSNSNSMTLTKGPKSAFRYATSRAKSNTSPSSPASRSAPSATRTLSILVHPNSWGRCTMR